ncbi:hypothetical protein HGM15179_019059, partial [Zosterops borbonicus]
LGPPCTTPLRYLNVVVSEPSPGVPQFMSIGFVDGIPFVRYDSEQGWMEPLMQWIKDGAELGYWDSETQLAVGKQHMGQLSGCDLLSDGSIRGSNRFSCDGRNFISFELGLGRFVAADGTAEITR